METITQIVTQLKAYIVALDWQYILTFIIICYGINHYKVKKKLQKITSTRTRTRYRVAIIGVVYGGIVYFIRGYRLSQIENLLQSFIFALVFHKFIMEATLFWLIKHALPESISKHLVDGEQLKKLHETEDK